MSNTADTFFNDWEDGWNMYLGLPDWASREAVVHDLSSRHSKDGLLIFMEKYQQEMKPYIRDDFYNEILFNQDQMKILARKYQLDGNVEVPFLKSEALGR